MQDDGLLILPTHRLHRRAWRISTSRHSAESSPKFRYERNADQPGTPRGCGQQPCQWRPHTLSPCTTAETRKLYTLLTDKRLCSELEPTTARPGAAGRGDPAALSAGGSAAAEFAAGKELAKGLHRRRRPSRRRSTASNIRSLCSCAPRRCMPWKNSANNGEVMPQKSTYFFPKLATGMVMYPMR